MSVSCECCVRCHVKPLRRADHSSRGVQPSVCVCVCVCVIECDQVEQQLSAAIMRRQKKARRNKTEIRRFRRDKSGTCLTQQKSLFTSVLQ
jgi:hypothetical protein